MSRLTRPAPPAVRLPKQRRTRSTPKQAAEEVIAPPAMLQHEPHVALEDDPLGLAAPRRARQPRHCTVGYTYYNGTYGACDDQPVPYLRLSGLWLEQLGFAIGHTLRITAKEGCLVIQLQV